MSRRCEAELGKIGTFGHGYTYGGHPVACAVGVKTLRSTRIDAPARAAGWRRIPPTARRLASHPLVGEARHLGLMGAIELVADKPSKAAFAQPGKTAFSSPSAATIMA